MIFRIVGTTWLTTIVVRSSYSTVESLVHMTTAVTISTQMVASYKRFCVDVNTACDTIAVEKQVAPIVCTAPFYEFVFAMDQLMIASRPERGEVYGVFLCYMHSKYQEAHAVLRNFIVRLNEDPAFSASFKEAFEDPWAEDHVLLDTATAKCMGTDVMNMRIQSGSATHTSDSLIAGHPFRIKLVIALLVFTAVYCAFLLSLRQYPNS